MRKDRSVAFVGNLIRIDVAVETGVEPGDRPSQAVLRGKFDDPESSCRRSGRDRTILAEHFDRVSLQIAYWFRYEQAGPVGEQDPRFRLDDDDLPPAFDQLHRCHEGESCGDLIGSLIV